MPSFVRMADEPIAADAFIADLRAAVDLVKSDPVKWSGGTAGLYGTMAKLPGAFLEESAKVFLDVMSHCVSEEEAAA